MTLASFQQFGKLLLLRERLKSKARGLKIDLDVHLISLLLIPSMPHALSIFNVLIASRTSPWDMSILSNTSLVLDSKSGSESGTFSKLDIPVKYSYNYEAFSISSYLK